MKICKNNFNIYFDNVLYCQECQFLIGNECKWLRIVGTDTPACGGVKSRNLPDIFTL